jgi:hypothetical protein
MPTGAVLKLSKMFVIKIIYFMLEKKYVAENKVRIGLHPPP